jgi:hypothetical protein
VPELFEHADNKNNQAGHVDFLIILRDVSKCLVRQDFMGTASRVCEVDQAGSVPNSCPILTNFRSDLSELHVAPPNRVRRQPAKFATSDRAGTSWQSVLWQSRSRFACKSHAQPARCRVLASRAARVGQPLVQATHRPAWIAGVNGERAAAGVDLSRWRGLVSCR